MEMECGADTKHTSTSTGTIKKGSFRSMINVTGYKIPSIGMTK